MIVGTQITNDKLLLISYYDEYGKISIIKKINAHLSAPL